MRLLLYLLEEGEITMLVVRAETSKRGFTLIELLVVIAIIAILAAILFPVFANAKKKGQQANCVGNMKQLAAAALTYFGDYGTLEKWQFNTGDNEYPFVKPDTAAPGHPGGDARRHAIFKYIKNAGVMKCPANFGSQFISGDIGHGVKVNGKHQFAWDYTWNRDCPYMPDSVKAPSRMPTWVEENTDPSVPNPEAPNELCVINDPSFTGSDVTSFRHSGFCNVAFLDGHVQAMKGGLQQSKATWPGTSQKIFKQD